MTDAIQDRILQAVFRLSRDTCPIDATILGRATGVSATEAAQALVALERAGLVDASRARLTMLGLARTCALGADQGGPVLSRPAAAPVCQRSPTPSRPPRAAKAAEPPRAAKAAEPSYPAQAVEPEPSCPAKAAEPAASQASWRAESRVHAP